jgi:toxin secretion/phage lysis holin
MSNTAFAIKSSFSLIGGLLGVLFGGLDGFLITLLVFMLLDYLSGVILAIYQKKLSSKIGFKGILKKVMILILVAVGTMLDNFILLDGAFIRTLVIFFYIANEGISLLENAALLGLPIPEKLKEVLAQLKESDK